MYYLALGQATLQSLLRIFFHTNINSHGYLPLAYRRFILKSDGNKYFIFNILLSIRYIINDYIYKATDQSMDID